MFRILEKSLGKGAQSADLYYLERNQESIQFESGKLKGILSKNTSGLTFRVKKDGQSGIVSASNLERDDEILQYALDASGEGEVIDYDLLHPAPLPDVKLTNDSIWERSYEEYVADGEKAIAIVKDYDPSLDINAAIYRQRDVKSYLNTNHCEYVSTRDQVGFFLAATLVENENFLQMGKLAQLCSNNYHPEELAHGLIELIKLGRVQKTLNSGKMPVLLTPTALSQLAFAMTSGLSGENVRIGISPLKGRIGEQVFSEMLTIVDDMTLPEGMESFAFDDEGTPAQRTTLFEKGVLQTYLLGLKSAHALNMAPNGKAQRRNMWFPRDYATAPRPSSSNWLIMPGTTPLEEMIAGIKEGIVIESMVGLVMGNLVQGAIDSDIDMGFKIENGKIVGRVKGAAIGFNLYEVLKNQVVAVEDRQHSAESLDNSTMLFPHILLKDMNITV